MYDFYLTLSSALPIHAAIQGGRLLHHSSLCSANTPCHPGRVRLLHHSSLCPANTPCHPGRETRASLFTLPSALPMHAAIHEGRDSCITLPSALPIHAAIQRGRDFSHSSLFTLFCQYTLPSRKGETPA
ncbi:hypothetical protein E2C01_020830 [Portunus trituberculatus]|uniref:Uncharacterized protein n=1 Tax=Portunus trituberculatus TaxID=210409 RepID=A0A5B7E349_PORTR|nr:hypothetical protein [Portunus trituberculatus]